MSPVNAARMAVSTSSSEAESISPIFSYRRRTSLREAVRLLESERLVEVRRGFRSDAGRVGRGRVGCCERIYERNAAQRPRSRGTGRDGLDGRLVATCYLWGQIPAEDER